MKGKLRRLAIATLLLGLGACEAPRQETLVATPPPLPQGQLALPAPEDLPKGPLQCVPYARLVSGIAIRGDAWTWWNQADGAFMRGRHPQVGAVLVFKRTSRLQRGHVSVVARIVNEREILVTHANWGSTSASRGKVAHNVRVVDMSKYNNWSEVRVWNQFTGSFGRTYPTYGFIYRPSSTQPASMSALPDRDEAPPGG